jgi:hypothetical protein
VRLDTRFTPPIEYAHDEFGGRAVTTEASYNLGTTVVLVGDSFSYGAERAFGDTLQGKLAAAVKANVLNFARNGSCSAYFAETVTEFTKRFRKQIDVLVIGLYPDMQIGDLPRVLAARQEYGRITYRGMNMSLSSARALEASNWRRWLLEIEVVLRERSSTFNTLFPPRPSPAFAISLKDTLSPSMFSGLLDALATNLSQVEAAAGVPADRTVIWFVASSNDLGRRDTDYVRTSEALWSDAIDMLRARGYVVVDPRREVEALPNPFTRSGHYQASAYEITAAAVLPEVQRLLAGAARSN